MPCDGSDAADLARYISAILQGMAVQAAGGTSREQLRKIAEMALRTWPPPGDGSHPVFVVRMEPAAGAKAPRRNPGPCMGPLTVSRITLRLPATLCAGRLAALHPGYEV